MKFRFGDRVRIASETSSFYLGHTGTVVDIAGNAYKSNPATYLVALDPIGSTGNREISFSETQLEHDSSEL